MAMLPLKEAAERAGVSLTTARRYVKSKEVPSDRKGPKGGYRADPVALEAHFRKKQEEKAEGARRPRKAKAKAKSEPVTEDPAPGPSSLPVAEQAPAPAAAVPAPPPENSYPDDGPPPEPMAPVPAPRSRPRRRLRRPKTESPAEVDTAPDTEPELAPDLLFKQQLDELLERTVSLTLTRIPTSDLDFGHLGAVGAQAIVGVSGKDFRVALEAGGIKPLIRERLGVGTVQVEFNGRGGSALDTITVVIPDLRLEFERLRYRADQLDRERRRREKAEKERRVDERRQRVLEREQGVHATWREGQQRGAAQRHTCLACLEAVRRVRAAADAINSRINSLTATQARRATELRREARLARREARREERAARRLRGQPADDTPLDEELAWEAERVPEALLRPYLEALARLRNLDIQQIGRKVERFLLDQGDALLTLPALHPAVTSAIEQFLAEIPIYSGFEFWRPAELLPSIPPPPPPLPMPPHPAPQFSRPPGPPPPPPFFGPPGPPPPRPRQPAGCW